jgi:hypothetical protein
MSRTTKSAVRLARMALAAAQEALPDYAHTNSPHKFTQPQLFACLVLKDFFKIDYRGLCTRLREWLELREALGLTHVPHYSTLAHAEKRITQKNRSTR